MIDTKELREALTRHGVRILNEDEVLEILDRLEAAESARRDDYQNWMTALDRNAELLAKLEAAKEDRSNFLVEMGKLCAKCDALCLRIEAAEEERDKLRAKIEAMEQQEPVASVWRCDNGHIHGSCERTLPMGTKLYALPGAKGEEK